jgi:lipopolysaccharide exporter
MWLTCASVAGNGLSFATIAVLAHMIPPRQFGQVALATAFADALVILTGMSLPAAIIRADDSVLEETFRAAIVIAGAVATVVVVLASAAAIALKAAGHSQIGLLLLALVGGRLFVVLGQCFGADLDRRFAFRQVATLQLVSIVIASGLAVALATLEFGVWALVARDVAQGIALACALVFMSSFRVTGWPSARRIAEVGRFAAKMTASRLSDMLFHRYDNVIVGLLAGSRELGLYAQSYSLAETINKGAAPMLTYVPLPTYVRLKTDHRRTQATFDVIMFFLVRITLPIVVVLIVFPADVLRLVFGENWTAAAPILALLAVYGGLLPLFAHVRELLIAHGAIDRILRVRTAQLAIFLPSVPIATLLWGGTGAAGAAALGMAVGVVAILLQARSLVSVGVRHFVVPVSAAILAGTAARLAATALDLHSGFAAGVVIGLVVYSAVILLCERSLVGQNLRAITTAFRHVPTAAPAMRPA